MKDQDDKSIRWDEPREPVKLIEHNDTFALIYSDPGNFEVSIGYLMGLDDKPPIPDIVRVFDDARDWISNKEKRFASFYHVRLVARCLKAPRDSWRF